MYLDCGGGVFTRLEDIGDGAGCDSSRIHLDVNRREV